MVIQSSSQGSCVHYRGHLSSCQVSYQSEEKTRNSQHEPSHLWIALVKKLLMAPPLFTKLFSFLDDHNERSEKVHLTSSTCPCAFQCTERYMWTIPYGRTQLSRSSQSRKQPMGISVTQTQGPSLGWESLHPFVLSLPESLLCLQLQKYSPATHFQSAAWEHCRALWFQSEEMLLGVVSLATHIYCPAFAWFAQPFQHYSVNARLILVTNLYV